MAGILRAAAGLGSAVSSGTIWARGLRPFTAAAALELDYWSEWEAEDEEQLAALPAKAEFGSHASRGLQWVFIGAAQKRVHAARLADLLDVPYISMASLLRQELSPRSDLHRRIAKAVNEGKLVPEDIIFGLLKKRLEEQHRREESGFILEGIPRTRLQAEILDQLVDVDLVVNFRCAEGHFSKIQEGNLCAHCGKSFSYSDNVAADHNSCSVTNSKHAVDLEASQFAKLRASSDQSKVLEEYYRRQNKLLNINMSSLTVETWQRLLNALHLQHFDSSSSQNKLQQVDSLVSPHKLTV